MDIVCLSSRYLIIQCWLQAIENDFSTWLCRNCKHGEQLCFVCRKLGKFEGEDKEVGACNIIYYGNLIRTMMHLCRLLMSDGAIDVSSFKFLEYSKYGLLYSGHLCRINIDTRVKKSTMSRYFTKCQHF